MAGLVLGLALLVLQADATSSPAVPPVAEAVVQASPEQGLERWRSKTDEERALLRERFEALRNLAPEERAELAERARALRAQRRDFERGLEPELREQLEHLPPWERDGILREHELSDRRSRGEDLRRSLAPEHRDWLESLVEAERPPRLDAAHERLRGHFGERAFGRLREGGHLGEADAARLDGLGGRERMRELLSIERDHLVAELTSSDRPPGLDEADLAELLAETSPERFMKRARRLGLVDRGRGHRGPQLVPPVELPTWVPELLGALRPTLEDRLALRDLERSEQRAAMDARVAERVRGLLDGKPWLSEVRRASLEGLDDRSYLKELESILEKDVLGAPAEPRPWGGARRGEGSGVPPEGLPPGPLPPGSGFEPRGGRGSFGGAGRPGAADRSRGARGHEGAGTGTLSGELGRPGDERRPD